MSLRNHTLSNFIGAVIPIAVLIVTVPLYLKFIGTERYGVLAVIWLLIGYFGVFDFGLARAVSLRIAQKKNNSEFDRSNLLWTAILATLVLGLLGGVLLLLIADYFIKQHVSISNISYSELSDGVRWLILMLPVLLPVSVMQGALQGRHRFIEVNLNNVIGTIVSQILPLSFAISGYNTLDFLVPAAIVAKLASFILFYYQCYKFVPLRGLPVFVLSELRPLISYGGWVSVMTMLSLLMVSIDRIVIAAISGAKAVAYYSVPYNAVTRLTIIPGSLATALFPRFVEAGEGDSRKLAERAVCQLIAVMTPVIILGLVFSHPLLILWVGSEFAQQSKGVAEFLLLGILVNSLAFPLHSVLLAKDNPKKVVIVYLIEIPIYFSALWFGLKLFGVVGAAAAWSLRVFIDTVLLARLANAITYMIKPASRAMVLTLVMFIVTMFTEPYSYMRFGFGFLLLCLALVFERVQLLEILNLVIVRKKVVQV